MLMDNCEIINCGKVNCKTVYGLMVDGELVLTSTNRALIFSACF